MYDKLKYLARSNCILHIGKRNNFLSLLIDRNKGLMNLSFKEKPPSQIRRNMRLNGFCWSRRKKYWRSFLNQTQEKRVRKIYQELNKYR